MSRVWRGWALLVGLIAVIWLVEIFAIPWNDAYYTNILIRIGINTLSAAGLALVLGFTGQFSLGQAGFMALGAYSAGYLALNLGVPPLPATIVGGLVAAAGGMAVGLPSLRLSGDYLAVVTLGFNGIIIVVIQNMDAVGAALGMIGLPQTTNFGWSYTWLVIGAFFIRNLLRSPHGRAMMAVRDNEIALRSLGVDTTRVKVVAFVVGAFWAGIAGGLIAFLNGSISPAQFYYDRSIELVAMVVLGGTGSLTGPMIAAAVLTALPEILRPVAEYRMLIYAAVLVVMMIIRPQGLLGTREIGDVVLGLARRVRGAKT